MDHSVGTITQTEWHAEVEVRWPDVVYETHEADDGVIIGKVHVSALGMIEIARYVSALGMFYAYVRAIRTPDLDGTAIVMNDRVEWKVM